MIVLSHVIFPLVIVHSLGLKFPPLFMFSLITAFSTPLKYISALLNIALSFASSIILNTTGVAINAKTASITITASNSTKVNPNLFCKYPPRYEHAFSSFYLTYFLF